MNTDVLMHGRIISGNVFGVVKSLRLNANAKHIVLLIAPILILETNMNTTVIKCI